METEDRSRFLSRPGTMDAVNTLRGLPARHSPDPGRIRQATGVPLNTLRMWDSGLRATPAEILKVANELSYRERRRTELLPIPQLAKELSIHKSTPESAIRSG